MKIVRRFFFYFLDNGDLEFEEIDGILQRRNLMGKPGKDVILVFLFLSLL